MRESDYPYATGKEEVDNNNKVFQIMLNVKKKYVIDSVIYYMRLGHVTHKNAVNSIVCD